jgi:hypothetical protein
MLPFPVILCMLILDGSVFTTHWYHDLSHGRCHRMSVSESYDKVQLGLRLLAIANNT